MKILLCSFLVIFLLSCANLKNEKNLNCNYDTKFLTFYLRDLGNLVEYEKLKSMDSLSYIDNSFYNNSFHNLEVITSNSTNMDSLNMVAIENPKSFLNNLDKWLKWLKNHECFTIDSASYIFNKANRLNKSNTTFISKKELENYKLKISMAKYKDLNSSEIDSIVTNMILQIRRSNKVGWKD